MNRRTTLLVVLALAACTADLPTAPDEAPGAPLGVALPPPPPPPSVLSASLGGGDGRAVSTYVGTYDYSIYSRITFSGLLNYSGRPDGYLPGTGAVDAAGILVQNQCHLNLGLRMVHPPVGSYLYAFQTCFYPARQVGSYIVHAVVKGEVYLDRWPGPPLSCNRGVTPCVSYSGSQTVTIEPLEGDLVLVANKTTVPPGGYANLYAKGVLASDPTEAVPLVVREWRFEGQGPKVGPYSTKVCGVTTAAQCAGQFFQSGHVVVEALVNGVVKTERIWITAVGGDTIPTPPVDTIPTDTIPTDTIPTDTLPGDCSNDGPGGLTVAACEPPDSTPPKAELKCNGADEEATIVRGATVTCTVQLDNGGKLASVRWLADPSSKDDILPPADEGGLSPDSTSSTWSGPLILNTSVRAWVVPQDASGELQATPVNLKVEPRSWTPWNVGTSTPGQPLSVIEFRLLDNNGHLPSPHIGSNARRRGQTLGFTAVADVDFRGERVLTAESGPNKGWSILERPYSVTSTYVYLHPDLFGGLWYAEQNGGVTRSSRLCTQRDIDGLALVASNHEYTSGDSHLSHWNTSLASLRLQSKVESLRGFKVTEARLTTLATRLAEQTYEDIHRQEVAWDRSVYPGIYNALGCDFDNVIGDGR